MIRFSSLRCWRSSSTSAYDTISIIVFFERAKFSKNPSKHNAIQWYIFQSNIFNEQNVWPYRRWTAKNFERVKKRLRNKSFSLLKRTDFKNWRNYVSCLPLSNSRPIRNENLSETRLTKPHKRPECYFVTVVERRRCTESWYFTKRQTIRKLSKKLTETLATDTMKRQRKMFSFEVEKLTPSIAKTDQIRKEQVIFFS